jgi:hypothetical protein
MNDSAGAGEMPEAEVFLADADALLDAFVADAAERGGGARRPF